MGGVLNQMLIRISAQAVLEYVLLSIAMIAALMVGYNAIFSAKHSTKSQMRDMAEVMVGESLEPSSLGGWQE